MSSHYGRQFVYKYLFPPPCFSNDYLETWRCNRKYSYYRALGHQNKIILWIYLGKVSKKKKKKSMEFSITGRGGSTPFHTFFIFFFDTKVTIFSQNWGVFILFFLQIKPFNTQKFFGKYSIWLPLYPFSPRPKCCKSRQKQRKFYPCILKKKS